MREIIEQISIVARRSKYVDHQSGVSARFSIANYRTMIASRPGSAARVLGERPAVPRISDLGHLYSSSLGKLELDMMGSHQMSERQVLDAILAEAIRNVFEQYVDEHGLDEIADIFAEGVKIEVGDMLPSTRVRRAAGARAAGLGQGLRSQCRQRRGGAGLLRRIRAGRPVRHRSHLAFAEPRPDRLRNRVSLRPLARCLGMPHVAAVLSAAVYSPADARSQARPYHGPRT